MELKVLNPEGARCFYGSTPDTNCNFRTKSYRRRQPTGTTGDIERWQCSAKIKMLVAVESGEIDQKTADQQLPIEQYTSCDSFFAKDTLDFRISNDKNTKQDEAPIGLVCKYSPRKEIACKYSSSYPYGELPSGKNYDSVCVPKLGVLKEKAVPEVLVKLEMSDAETEDQVAAAQQRLCDRYEPRKNRIIKQFVTDDSSVPLKSLKGLTQVEALAYQSIAKMGTRSDVLGEILSGSLKPIDIPEGTEISGFQDLKDLDVLVLKLMAESAKALGLGVIDKPFNHATDIKNYLSKMGFYGSFREISPRLIINNVERFTQEPPIPRTPLLQWVTEAGMFISGKGRVDTYIGRTEIVLGNSPTPKITTKHKHLVKEQGLIDLAMMLDDSQITYEESYRERLAKVITTGFGLGKRR